MSGADYSLHTLVMPSDQRFGDAVVPMVAEGGLEPCHGQWNTFPASIRTLADLRLGTLSRSAGRPRTDPPPPYPLAFHADYSAVPSSLRH
ncbi:hypothetical protein [Micromonospora sp. CPCC 205558]|uniref:hypothetical protein n=1 Tax=Micromonospora sp. CPCC 205558 TaxID=3122403 RepID=UPI002FF33154